MPLGHRGRRVAHSARIQEMSNLRPGQALGCVAERVCDGLKLTLGEDLTTDKLSVGQEQKMLMKARLFCCQQIDIDLICKYSRSKP
jgi:hypothetical protein